MPQPLQEGYSIQNRPQLVAKYPEHAIGMALVVAEWAALEYELIQSFTAALFVFGPLGKDAGRVAQDAWEAMGTIRSRLEFVEAVAKNSIPDDLFQELSKDIHPEVVKRSQERNKVAHAYWHFCDKYPDDLIYTSGTEVPMRYSVKDFEDIANRINATANKVATYWRLRVQYRPFPLLQG